MSETVNSLPLENVTKDQWIFYLSVVIAVCRADGLSKSEESAMKQWISENEIDESCFELAAANKKTAQELVPDETTRSWLAPYIIRDAIRLASVDGFSDEENIRLMQAAKELGCEESVVEDIREFISLSNQAQEKWPASKFAPA